MRLSRTAWIVLGAGIFVIAFVSLYMFYSRQVTEQEQLETSLASAEATLPQLISEKDALEDQLAEWEKELADVTSALNKSRSKLAIPVHSIEYDEKLFGIADECDLEVASITASEPAEEEYGEVEGITYVVTSFEVTVQPADSPPATVASFKIYIDEAVTSIIDFVKTIATAKDFATATIEVVSIENLEPPSETEVGEAEKPSATINLNIYSYQGE